MPLNKLDIEAFLQLPPTVPVLDVRSPGEYAHAHIPGAISFPLFSDEERRVVGTAYKQESRENAIKIGLAYFGKDLVSRVEAAEKILAGRKGSTQEFAVHCWRGGMRSAAVAWLLDLYGFKVNLLAGGYKAYRRRALQVLEKDYSLLVLGGSTGSNKTAVLQKMAKAYSVIDLEGLAGHKGSAFGNLERIPQPGQEQFENLLAAELERCTEKFPGQPIWLEAESQRVGSINIPLHFFNNMRQSTLVQLNIPFGERLDLLVRDYGRHSREVLINAILRIKKKLGGLEAKTAVNCLFEDDVKGCFAVLLKYYDKLYAKSVENNDFKERKIVDVETDTTDPLINMKKILGYGDPNH